MHSAVHNFGSDAWFALCVLFAGTMFVAFTLISQARRRNAIRALAVRLGFAYLGESLPRSLDLGNTPPANATSVWNVIDGEIRGIRIVAFDYRRGVGKSSYRRTAIAALTVYDPFGSIAFSRNMKAERCGRWVVVYQPRDSGFRADLMAVAELEAQLFAIRNQ